MGDAPLHGLKVLELATGVAGPYAGRLLATLGATVVKAEADDGDPARRAPIDDEELHGTSPLYLHLNSGKRNVSLSALPAASSSWADVVIDDRVRGQSDDTPWTPEALADRDTTLVSVTAWGFDADDPGRIQDELLVQAASGALTQTGDPEGPPLRLPGWQSQYLAGANAAAFTVLCALAGGAHHVDVSWLGSMAGAVEPQLSRMLTIGHQEPPQGPRIRQAFPSGAFRCADGHVVVGTVRRHDWEMQCLLYGRPELVDDGRYATPAARGEHMDELEALIQPWYDAHDKRKIFEQGLEVLWAVGMVMTAEDALADPHLAERGFLARHQGPDGAFVAPTAPWRGDGASAVGRRVATTGEHDSWFAAELNRT